ncbi:MAG: nucleoside hydrolase [Alphaproteobacteria bacterium]|nr:nucleoside hydrolase [Alphaproteobacteria bacterium]
MAARSIIIDCDPGQDDAIAILMALASPEDLHVLGITCVAGNAPLVHTQKNARRICELAGRPDLGIFAGCPRPMIRPLRTAAHIHGQTGLDGSGLPEEPGMPLQDRHAVDFIVDACLSADDEAVTICLLGPMTNLALAIVKEPRILPKIKSVVFMGGAAFGVGNITPSAEFNIAVDPHAARIVVESGVDLVMFGLDVTHQVITTPARLAAIRAIQTPVGQAASGMLTFYDRDNPERYGASGSPLHDPCVIAWLLKPELFRGRRAHVAVETDSALTMGRTVVDWWGVTENSANATVMDRVDANGFYELLLDRLARL